MKRFLLLLTLCALCTGLANAYVLEGARWGYGYVYIALELYSTAWRLQYATLEKFPLYDGAQSWESVAAAAANAWNGKIRNTKLAPYYYFNPYSSGYSNDHANEMYFGKYIDGFQIEAPILAVTSYTYDPYTQAFIGAAVCFNSDYIWNSYWGPLSPYVQDFRRVATHELGHVLGLAHPDDYGQKVNAIMNRYESNTYILQPDDIAGAQYLYGAP